MKNLEDTGNAEDSKKENSNKPSKSLPNQTEKFDITTLNKNAYEKRAPDTGTDVPEANPPIRKGVKLDRGDVFRGTDGDWYIAGESGNNYEIQMGSDVYYRRVDLDDLGGFTIAELIKKNKEDRDAIISQLTPREQAYLYDRLK